MTDSLVRRVQTIQGYSHKEVFTIFLYWSGLKSGETKDIHHQGYAEKTDDFEDYIS